VPVTANKGVIGHLIGGAGAVEALVTLESVRRGVVPPTANSDDVDPAIDALIDVVRTATPIHSPVGLSNSFGFGGHNATLVIGH
jgi:3-oxoacyl-[acyl-carrier-protein] synthase II